MRRLLLLALALTCAARAQVPAASADDKAIWQVENDINRAFIDADTAKISALSVPRFVLTEPNGMVLSRREILDTLAHRTTKFDALSLHEAAIAITGNTAVVTGRFVVHGTRAGAPFGQISETTDTLVRQDGAWLFAATHTTILANSSDTAVTPLWRDGGGWMKRHAGFVAKAKDGGVDLLFVGDSITDFWQTKGRGKDVWEKYYGGLHAADIGISGDRTQHVLWRLQNGEVDGLHPKAIVLMIGTNNTGYERDGVTPRNQVPEVAAGVKAVVAELRHRLPDAKILLLGIFPRGHLPDDFQRHQVAEVNRLIASLDDGDHVHYLDIGAHFLTPDGVLEKDIMPDYLHPSPKGYEIWAQAIATPLQQLL